MQPFIKKKIYTFHFSPNPTNILRLSLSIMSPLWGLQARKIATACEREKNHVFLSTCLPNKPISDIVKMSYPQIRYLNPVQANFSDALSNSKWVQLSTHCRVVLILCNKFFRLEYNISNYLKQNWFHWQLFTLTCRSLLCTHFLFLWGEC